MKTIIFFLIACISLNALAQNVSFKGTVNDLSGKLKSKNYGIH